ncbi:MAG: hypothetical protein LC791_18475, partial [Acidobacteria bacterium]|nr:hypothetical protein [Acidobacteriota bacterium]
LLCRVIVPALFVSVAWPVASAIAQPLGTLSDPRRGRVADLSNPITIHVHAEKNYVERLCVDLIAPQNACL